MRTLKHALYRADGFQRQPDGQPAVRIDGRRPAAQRPACWSAWRRGHDHAGRLRLRTGDRMAYQAAGGVGAQVSVSHV